MHLFQQNKLNNDEKYLYQINNYDRNYQLFCGMQKGRIS